MMGLLTALVMAGATVVGLVILGTIFLLGVRLLRPGAAKPRGADAEEAQLLQEIHRSLSRLEERVETLETLVLEPRAGKGDGQ
uniref:Phage shock protein B n=1 Tax=Desulfovibrio sp. U5L TaxID=596152 RepID=I2Q742_9BACT